MQTLEVSSMTNVCLEAFATMWLSTKKKIMREPIEEQVFTAQDNLEQCKKSMELRELELIESIKKLTVEAVAKKKIGDLGNTKVKLAERARVQKRLCKLRASMNIIDTQLDAIKSSELDKEIMISLKASSMALKKAGIGVNATEVENVMSELDDHLREMQDITSVLSTPINAEYDDDIEKEFEELMNEDQLPLSVNQMSVASVVSGNNNKKLIEIVEEDEDDKPMDALLPA